METQTPITLFRGDDTDAFSLRTITIKLSGDLSLTNATAKFTLMGFTKTWTNAETQTGTLTLVFTDEDTKNMPLGTAFGTLRLYDISSATGSDVGKQLTVVNTIPFLITNKVVGTPTAEYGINVTLAVDTEINITFTISGGSGGDSLWSTGPSGNYLYPSSNSVQRVLVPALASVSALGSKYTLADVKNLLNTVLAALKA